MNQYSRADQGMYMSRTVERANVLELTTKHRFGVVDPIDLNSTNRGASPKKSPSGLFYLDCVNCGRSVFHDGTGSAAQSACGR